MAKKRGRPQKSVLGQTKEEVKVTVPEEVVDELEEKHDVDAVEEIKEIVAEEAEISVDEVKVDVVPEEPVVEEPVVEEEPEVVDEAEEPVVEEEPRERTVADLNSDELKLYYRTGRIPK
jgi:hypothetical protein